MKKFLPIALVGLVLLGIVTYIIIKRHTVEVAKEAALVEKRTVIGGVSSIKDAMEKGQKMHCTYTTPDNQGTVVTSSVFIDGQKYKFASGVDTSVMYGLFDGDTQYTWGESSDQGWKMSRTCLLELSKIAPEVAINGASNVPGTSNGSQDVEKPFLAGQNVVCESAPNEDFSIPTTITFVDQCETMKKALESTSATQRKIPAGMNIPRY